ncbi:MAG: M23 family metallopeptidase [Fidelibacterota bacterium]
MKKTKPKRYTILFIPDTDDESKSYSLSRWWLRLVIGFILLVILALGGLNWYFIPQALDYANLRKQYDELLAERVKMASLYRDLQRLQQMNELVRARLSAGVPEENSAGGDSTVTDSARDQKEFHLSFVENIPSVAPLDGYITQRLVVHSPVWQKNHYGIDIACKEGEAVKATAAGTVVFSGWTYDLGNLIILYHGNGYFSHYGHNQLNLVEQHQVVQRGEVIASAGDTGISSGPHLHFEIWKDGQVLDPFLFFPEYKQKDLSTSEND